MRWCRVRKFAKELGISVRYDRFTLQERRGRQEPAEIRDDCMTRSRLVEFACESPGVPNCVLVQVISATQALLSNLIVTSKPLICSTGMASGVEIRSGSQHFRIEGAIYVLLHCNSTYPPFKDVNLRA